MTKKVKEQFKGSINPVAISLKDKQNRQDFNQTQEKQRIQIDKISNEREVTTDTREI